MVVFSMYHTFEFDLFVNNLCHDHLTFRVTSAKNVNLIS